MCSDMLARLESGRKHPATNSPKRKPGDSRRKDDVVRPILDLVCSDVARDRIRLRVLMSFAARMLLMTGVAPHFSVTPTTGCVLGVDPGLNRTGYAILERSRKGPILREGGVIRSTASLTLAERVHEIGQGLREVVQEFQPQVLAIEQVFSSAQFPGTAILMAHARGAILYAAADAKIAVVDYAPREIKRLLTGSGKASKEQIQHAIRQELGLDHVLEPNDVADAFAVALCHYHTTRATGVTA